MISRTKPTRSRPAGPETKAVNGTTEPTPSLATSTSDVARTLKFLGVCAIAGLLIWLAGQVLLLMFAGVLLAVILRAAAVKVAGYLKTTPGVGLLVVILGTVLAVLLFSMIVAPQVVREGQLLINSLPNAWQRFQAYVSPVVDLSWLQQLQQTLQPIREGAEAQAQAAQNMLATTSDGLQGGGADLVQNVWSRMLGVLSSTFGAFASLIIILTTALYLAADPETYRKGVVRMLPPAWRSRADDVLEQLRTVLVGWSAGMAVSMSVIAVLTFVGLAILQVPLALILAVLAGLLNFIPNFGPIISGVPAVLLALGGGVNTAIYVLMLYLVIQFFESYVLTPNIQKHTISLPPVLTLGAQILLGITSGVLGLLLATPLAAVTLVLVRELYVKDYLERGASGKA